MENRSIYDQTQITLEKVILNINQIRKEIECNQDYQ